ncbi:hypothetical protein THRCLA_04543 [Thraustotheca clavata]|uniref:FAD-binding FR-type domain-containing protein n=1 Tax=Thraustotheca clavata TaxID=74557 RepID=A0A1V9ZZF8_9STRA|nr:hypothetical protein THRCLA_04543 [Thraustotheca clavata]
MGGAVSQEEASMVYCCPDGALRIKPSFLAVLQDEMELDVKDPIVTREQEALIKKNWTAVCNGTNAFAMEKSMTPAKFFYTTFYSIFFREAPSVRPMFRSSMTFQGRMLTGVIGSLATAVHAETSIANIQQLAINHAKYGATKEHYAALGRTLLQTLEIVSGSEWSEEIKKAYLTSYCFLYYIMLPVVLDTPPTLQKASLRAIIKNKEMLSSDIARLTIEVHFPLRYHPGDSVFLCLPMREADARRSYAITSLYEPHSTTFDICVQNTSITSAWLCNVSVDSHVRVYWIDSALHFETDTPELLPLKPLLVSEEIGAAPFYVMVKGLHSVHESFNGDVIWLQCASKPIEYFQTPFVNATSWNRCRIATDTSLTQARLLEIAPDLAERQLYIVGSAAFVAEAKRIFIAAGGTEEAIIIPVTIFSHREYTNVQGRLLIMGGAVSLENAKIIHVEADGSLSITKECLATLGPEMDFGVKNPIVTRRHSVLIQKNWAAICKGTDAFDQAKHSTPTKFFYTTFYTIFFEAAPVVRSMFRSSMTFQGKMLTGIIDAMAKAISAENAVKTIQGLAINHAKYGATKEHYVILGETLMKTLEVISGNEWNEEIKNAYLATYSFLYYIMLPVILHTTPAPIVVSIPGRITSSEPMGSMIKRIQIDIDFPLRYHPGDSILLGLPMPTGEVRRCYAITSLYDEAIKTIEICVENASVTSLWLCLAPVDTILRVFWVNSEVHFETDSPDMIPRKPFFVSDGVAAAPFYAMIKGLETIHHSFMGDVIALQCRSVPYFETPFSIPSSGANVVGLNWEWCKVYTADKITLEKIHEITPDVHNRQLFVAGSQEFISEAMRLFCEAGGLESEMIIYSFENERFQVHHV